jgi:hypothetical protein
MVRSARSSLIALMLGGALACADEPAAPAPESSAAAATGGGGSGGQAHGGAEEGAGCGVNAVDMIVERDGGVATRLHVPVEHDGLRAALFFDTGSALSFLSLGADAEPYLPHAGELSVGCDTVQMAGRNFDSFGTTGGLELIGILGADYLLAAPSEIDTARGRLVRRQGSLSPEQRAWPGQPYEDVQGHIITAVTLDGSSLRLMFDTGSPYILWLGEQGQPGDIPVTAMDAEGNLITMYLGEAALGMVGEPPERVPVLRAPSFPYFEQTVEALGGNIHGLLGLSALRGRTLVIDPDEVVLHLEP